MSLAPKVSRRLFSKKAFHGKKDFWGGKFIGAFFYMGGTNN